MDWTTFISIAGLNFGIFAFIHNDMKSLANRLDGHAQRIDHLYSIIVEMLKDRKS